MMNVDKMIKILSKYPPKMKVFILTDVDDDDISVSPISSIDETEDLLDNKILVISPTVNNNSLN